MISPLQEVVFRLSMKRHASKRHTNISHHPASFTVAADDAWRKQELDTQLVENFDPALLRGKHVLDFGCGSGFLTALAIQHGAESAIGSDLSAALIARARRHLSAAHGNDKARFIIEEDPRTISLPDESVDVVLCFDVMEHIMEYQSIIHEWRRVLSPGGRVLIWWSVWWHPYGHHLTTMIPLPWVHVFLNDAALLNICARVYDRPEFEPRHWHFDEDGARKANPYAHLSRLNDLYLNKLTIRKFEAAVRLGGLQVWRRSIRPFTGSRFALLKKVLVKTPWPDFFCSAVIYELGKPVTAPG